MMHDLQPKTINRIFKDLVIVNVFYHPYKNCYNYTCISPEHFRIIETGEKVPKYKAAITYGKRGGILKVEFKEVVW